MKKITEKIADLINVKTIVTFAVTDVFVVLALKGVIPSETVMAVVVMVVGFYFGTQHEKNNSATKALPPQDDTYTPVINIGQEAEDEQSD